MAEFIHVDQQALLFLIHNIPEMIISVEHVHIVRHRVDQRIELVIYFSRHVVFQDFDPVQGSVFDIRHNPLFHRTGVDEFQEFDTHFHKFIQALFSALQKLNIGFCVQQLINRAVAPFFNLNHIIGDRRRNAEDKSGTGQFPLMMNSRQGICIFVHLDDVFPVKAIYLPVRPLADQLAAFQ